MSHDNTPTTPEPGSKLVQFASLTGLGAGKRELRTNPVEQLAAAKDQILLLRHALGNLVGAHDPAGLVKARQYILKAPMNQKMKDHAMTAIAAMEATAPTI